MAVQEQKVLKYKGQIVFEKIAMSTFQRIPKLYQQNEACFMFVNEGEFSVRTPDEFLSFKKGKGLLAKCFDYFFETNEKQRLASNKVEVLGILLYPSIVEELFQFDIILVLTSFFLSENIDGKIRLVQKYLTMINTLLKLN